MIKKKYRYKLNMLEPGLKMFKAIGILLSTGVLLALFKIRAASYLAFGGAFLVFLVLLVLIAIEQHQDHQLYLSAKEEDPDIE